jgi:NAD+ kinase
MKVAIYSRGLDAEQENPLQFLLQALAQQNIDVVLYKQLHETFNLGDDITSNISYFQTSGDLNKDVDCLISLGGDGTMLDAVTLIKDSAIPLLGVNFGRLGF